MNYYNEWDKGAAAWLRELIKAGLIPNGYVDDRSITDVRPSDLEGFTQCHFFCGIAGWPLALAIAGIPATVPLWTGSPPCQPFSVAGAGAGKRDSRHLAPAFLDLVAECRPQLIFGEQVAAAVTKDQWADSLLIELAEEGYASGFTVLPACSVGAPHKRDRLFFGAVGNSSCERHYRVNSLLRQGEAERGPGSFLEIAWSGEAYELAHTNGEQRDGSKHIRQGRRPEPANGSIGRSLADANDTRPQRRHRVSECADQQPARPQCVADSLEQPGGQRWERREAPAPRHQHDGETPNRSQSEYGPAESGAHRFLEDAANPHHGFWSDADWLGCRDGKFRPVESGSFPLAHGIPARVGRLRGYGNAIVPQVAAEFIKAFRGACGNQ